MRELLTIAHIETDFPTKFGIPRQSGLTDFESRIVFEPEYRNADALRGLEGFSHIWLLWDFSEAHREGEGWSPTVRPPRLGGNKRMGVWATRSPFRPNHIGLSSVRLINISPNTPEGPVLEVSGADLMDGTPILDIKPYIPYCDAHPEASGGFTTNAGDFLLKVDFPAVVDALWEIGYQGEFTLEACGYGVVSDHLLLGALGKIRVSVHEILDDDHHLGCLRLCGACR